MSKKIYEHITRGADTMGIQQKIKEYRKNDRKRNNRRRK